MSRYPIIPSGFGESVNDGGRLGLALRDIRMREQILAQNDVLRAAAQRALIAEAQAQGIPVEAMAGAPPETIAGIIDDRRNASQFATSSGLQRDTLNQRRAEFDHGVQQDSRDAAAMAAALQPGGMGGGEYPGFPGPAGPDFSGVSPDAVRFMAQVDPTIQARQHLAQTDMLLKRESARFEQDRQRKQLEAQTLTDQMKADGWGWDDIRHELQRRGLSAFAPLDTEGLTRAREADVQVFGSLSRQAVLQGLITPEEEARLHAQIRAGSVTGADALRMLDNARQMRGAGAKPQPTPEDIQAMARGLNLSPDQLQAMLLAERFGLNIPGSMVNPEGDKSPMRWKSTMKNGKVTSAPVGNGAPLAWDPNDPVVQRFRGPLEKNPPGTAIGRMLFGDGSTDEIIDRKARENAEAAGFEVEDPMMPAGAAPAGPAMSPQASQLKDAIVQGASRIDWRAAFRQKYGRDAGPQDVNLVAELLRELAGASAGGTTTTR